MEPRIGTPPGEILRRVCEEAVALGVAFARFKLALDDYGRALHSARVVLGETPGENTP